MKRLLLSAVAVSLSLAIATPALAFAPFEHTMGRSRPSHRGVEMAALNRYKNRFSTASPMKENRHRITLARMQRRFPQRLVTTGSELWSRPSRRALYHGMRD